mgnify:FL=1
MQGIRIKYSKLKILNPYLILIANGPIIERNIVVLGIALLAYTLLWNVMVIYLACDFRLVT